MAQNLLTATNLLQFISKNSKFILITSDDLNNSNFIINQFIQALSKGGGSMQMNSPVKIQNSKVFGVFLNQSYASYSFIQIKCGNNLKNLRELNQFRCLDMVNDLDQFIEQDNDQFDFKKFKNNLIEQLIDFYNLNQTEDDDKTDVKDFNTTKVLIIDDITSLLSLNVKLNDLVNFVSFINHFCTNFSISLIIQSYVDTSRQDQLVKLDTYLDSLSDLVLLISKLETGYSNKIDGNLEIINYIAETHQTYLFKSTERQSKLYSPGTI